MRLAWGEGASSKTYLMRVGAYEIQEELGRGGMGVVYRARGPRGEDVAVKVLRRDSGDRDAFARFEREQRLVAALGKDEGFVQLLDAGVSEHGPYLVMPFVPGSTLRQRLKQGALGVEEAVKLGHALAQALGQAHARGIVHRDLKPENVLFAADG